MKDKPEGVSKTKKRLQIALKILVTGACLWYVSGKIDFQKTGEALRAADWIYLLPALILFIFSKWTAANRLNIYFRDIGIWLNSWQSIRLYWLGMFYNLFLPGSISGDAYKVILLTKKYDVPYKKTAASVLLDRVSGLLGLFIIGTAYCYAVQDNTTINMLISAGVVLAVIVFYFVTRRFFKDFRRNYFRTLWLGTLVQLFQVGCIYMIMNALDIPIGLHAYILIFLISSVVSVLPLTIGGLGIREIVFLEGATRFGLVQENAVVISILFYLLTVLTSLMGIGYVFRDPLKVKDPLLSP